MRPLIEQLGDSFVHACAFKKAHTYEQFVPENLLCFQVSGETQIYTEKGEMVLRQGQMLLARRNQFAKSVKVPGEENEKYQCISVILSVDRLRQYAMDNGISCGEKYDGRKNVFIEPNSFLKGYFVSLVPYVEQWNRESEKLASLKVNEAIELLLHIRPDLKGFLFDLADPKKQDLEAFMLKNYHYNVPIDHFAKLSGRSLTSFKREFAQVFNTSPGTWLMNRRLSEALYLIGKKSQKPQDIYLDLGFENLSHFYSSFKRKYGVTPSQVTGKQAIVN